MGHDRKHHDGCHDEGVYRKYDVRRMDGSDQPGGRHHGCRYLVLDLDHDPSARYAARMFAEDIAESRARFSHELLVQLDKLERGEPLLTLPTGGTGMTDRGSR